MNKLNGQKFLNLFNEILSNKKESTVLSLLPVPEKGDEVDQVNSHKEQLLNMRLNGRQSTFFKKVEAAKERLLDGTFGQCQDCGCEISENRLLARPTATMCINCQEEKERNERGSFGKRRDLRIVKNSDTTIEDTIAKQQKFGSMKEIKFESIVDM